MGFLFKKQNGISLLKRQIWVLFLHSWTSYHDYQDSQHKNIYKFTETRCCPVLSCFIRAWLFVTPWAVARQSPLSMGFSSQEYCSGLPCPPPGDLPDPGMEPASLVSCCGGLGGGGGYGGVFTTSTTWKPENVLLFLFPSPSTGHVTKFVLKFIELKH